MIAVARCVSTELEGCDRILLMATGDSTVAAEIVSCGADTYSDTPVYYSCGGRVPAWVQENDGVVILSNDGMEPELLESYDRLIGIGCRMVCVTPGGVLGERCARDGTCVRMMPEGLSPQDRIGFEMGVLASILAGAGMGSIKDSMLDTAESVSKECDHIKECADGISDRLLEGIPAIYGTLDLHAASMYLSGVIRRRQMVPTFYGELPEFNHNEIVGWADPNVHASNLRIFVLRGNNETSPLDHIIDSMSEVLRSNGREVNTVSIGGSDPFSRIFRVMMIGQMIGQNSEVAL